MAELVPAPFADLVTRLYREPATQDSVFGLPRRSWYVPDPAGPDHSVTFHGRSAGNALGPAAGPHTQMAQNLLLSYVAGSRILELKTVQVDDRLTIGRPCIDMTNVGYNIEWSQELLVEDSLREYVAGAMLIEMWKGSDPLARSAEDADAAGAVGGSADSPAQRGQAPLGFEAPRLLTPFSPAGEKGSDPWGQTPFLFDISVGYDLAGIKSEKVRGFLDGMRDARAIVERLLAEIPREYAEARDLDYPTRLSDSITLSTFHGCPADEIERICEFLIGECDFDVIVKMNPPMLGREQLEHLLHDVLGYTELVVNPAAYASGLSFEEGVQMTARLTRFAAARGRGFGLKFSNTLEVLNHRTFFTPDNKVMYLSGQPLHVITLTLTDEFRRAVGPHVPLSFSAGIDHLNFPTAVGCGFVPVTVSTDLLRPGGYARLPRYLRRLSEEMQRVGAATIDEFILKRFGQADEAQRRANGERTPQIPPLPRGGRGGSGTPQSEIRNPKSKIAWAGLLNTTVAAKEAQEDPRYRAAANRAVPKRINSHLVTFDCVTCDKCIPVCPNAANFTYPTPKVAFDYHDWLIDADGRARPAPETKRFEIEEEMQIACYADFCNECGNCDTFCPEYGGPYIKKPSFYGSVESWQRAAPRDGFVVGVRPLAVQGPDPFGPWIRGRVHSDEVELIDHSANGEYRFADQVLEAVLCAADHSLLSVARKGVRPRNYPGPDPKPHRLDMGVYHTLRYLLAGVLDSRWTNQVNVCRGQAPCSSGA